MFRADIRDGSQPKHALHVKVACQVISIVQNAIIILINSVRAGFNKCACRAYLCRNCTSCYAKTKSEDEQCDEVRVELDAVAAVLRTHFIASAQSITALENCQAFINATLKRLQTRRDRLSTEKRAELDRE